MDRIQTISVPPFELTRVSTIEAVQFLSEQAAQHEAAPAAEARREILFALFAAPASLSPVVTLRECCDTPLLCLAEFLAVEAGLLVMYTEAAVVLYQPRNPVEKFQATQTHMIPGIQRPTKSDAGQRWRDAQKLILAKYPPIGLAGSPQHRAFLRAFLSAGGDHDLAMAIADAIFGPQDSFPTDLLPVVQLPPGRPPQGHR